MALDRNGTGTSTGASRDNSAEARGASNRNEGSRGGDRDRTSSSKSSASSSKSTGAASSASSGMSEAAQRSAYGAGRAAAQAMASGTAKSSGSGTLASGTGKVSDRIGSINSALSSYGVSRWSSDKNTDMTAADQRAAYGAGQINAQQLGTIENLRNVVRNGTATQQERDQLADIANKANSLTGANIVGGGLLGSIGKWGARSAVSSDTYNDALAKGITDGSLRLSGSYNENLGQGGVVDTAVKGAASLIAGPAGGFIGEALTQPNQNALTDINKLVGNKVGAGTLRSSNGSGFTNPAITTNTSASDLTSGNSYEAYYDPTKWDFIAGTRGV